MSDLTAYRSTHPDVLASLEAYRTAMKQWHVDSDALLKELGFTKRFFLVSTGFGQRWITGVEYRDGDLIPDGWKTWQHSSGQTILTPHKAKKVGKAAAAKISACQPPNLPQNDLPGMPGERVCNDGMMRSPSLREMAGAVYARWTADGPKEIPAGGPEREAHLGDSEPMRRMYLRDHVDLAFWERLKLSEYYAAVEAADAANGGEGQC